MLSFILSAKRLVKGLWRSFKRPQFLSLFTTLFLIILSGTLFYKGTEGWYWLDAMYFAVVSLIPTGVETGLYPATSFSKIFTMIYLIVGTGVMFIMLLTLGRSIVDFSLSEEEEVAVKKRLKK
ncbi:potassium channel family protein [Lysinibacillus sp. FSL R7-0073]|uniref:Ion channel protein n=1 Tax=Lysinibacillus fusiformis TaxID=28031 RepID=A0A1E4R170_9BACI|nr:MULTISPECIES: potassium channel family protein [Lysinibacillus]MBD8523041.1 two pore domain potassium channel family protein [Lysinibacillus fusiformis]MCR8855274.1 potassium channel family protein [Lysinibacillus fusiformis]MED4889083.1 potassium channel family protein [Lysinibacillus fusiformis]ODV54206.1 Ion channel protein [Lysinibacillus fusiformis]WKT76046.1 potassium channel family protein [Lysinibacillus fusiformis]